MSVVKTVLLVSHANVIDFRATEKILRLAFSTIQSYNVDKYETNIPLFWSCWSYFDLTWQRPWMHLQEINNHLAEVFDLYLPIIVGTRLVIVEFRSHGSGHDRRGLD